MGRVTVESNATQTTSYTLNAKSQVIQAVTTQGATTTTTTNNYGTGTGYALGQLVSSSTVQGANTQTVTHSFAWYEGAEKTQTIVTGSGAQTPGTTLFTLDAFGQVTSIGYSGGTTGSRSYIHDSAGQGIVSSSNVNGVPSTDN